MAKISRKITAIIIACVLVMLCGVSLLMFGCSRNWLNDAVKKFTNTRFAPDLNEVIPGALFGKQAASAGVKSLSAPAPETTEVSAANVKGGSSAKASVDSFIELFEKTQGFIQQRKQSILNEANNWGPSNQNEWAHKKYAGEDRYYKYESNNGNLTMYKASTGMAEGANENFKLTILADGTALLYSKYVASTHTTVTYSSFDDETFVSMYIYQRQNESEKLVIYMSFDFSGDEKVGTCIEIRNLTTDWSRLIKTAFSGNDSNAWLYSDKYTWYETDNRLESSLLLVENGIGLEYSVLCEDDVTSKYSIGIDLSAFSNIQKYKVYTGAGGATSIVSIKTASDELIFKTWNGAFWEDVKPTGFEDARLWLEPEVNWLWNEDEYAFDAIPTGKYIAKLDFYFDTAPAAVKDEIPDSLDLKPGLFTTNFAYHYPKFKTYWNDFFLDISVVSTIALIPSNAGQLFTKLYNYCSGLVTGFDYQP